jgi:hypothetical protein
LHGVVEVATQHAVHLGAGCIQVVIIAVLAAPGEINQACSEQGGSEILYFVSKFMYGERERERRGVPVTLNFLLCGLRDDLGARKNEEGWQGWTLS